MSGVSLATANRIIESALIEAAALGLKPVSVAVLDADGHVISLQRQDGASMFRNEVAIGKAWGAVAMGVSSRALAAKAKRNPAFFNGLVATSRGRLLPNPGGVLIRDAAAAILGAVGISGDSGEADARLAVAGIEAAGLTADDASEE